MSYTSLIDPKNVSQMERLNDRQVVNNAGGYVFALDIWARLDRFLVLGSDAPTYYQSARKLTRENAKSVEACWKADHRRTADRIVEISKAGRAPKNSPAIFALALGTLSDDVAARRAALDAVTSVCRTASHLFEFAALIDALGRGWGRSVSRAISGWYENRSPDKLAYQMTKYRSRNGYTHERVIQRVHPKAADGDAQRIALYRWACEGNLDGHVLPELVLAHLAAMKTEKASELIPLIEKHELTWEQIPTWALTDAKVWEALLPNLGMTALLRNLGTLTDLGVVKPLGGRTSEVADKLTDAEAVRQSRLHPYSILNALAVYRSGKSVKGERTWGPVSNVIDALDDAFYLAFGNVEPTGKRHLLSLDVSGSMGTAMIGGVLSAREASAAMSMATARSEKHHHFVGFGHSIHKLGISSKMSLPEVIRSISDLPFGRTDCSAPMLHALKAGLEVDAFVVYTDNETYMGSMHPSEALKKYRRETGIPAKLIVAGMTSTGFSIADPNDAGMFDIVGFDSDAVSLMADFVRA
ncbi:TROVE domain-containing protein [Pararhizobium sp. BT-229]|uniref:TROVE domain-containing protein n=1 Tax=Pararhizobium sp. BT-229 TaxID=2986923 RepID=UPI0021F79B3C|nr:TROVE domain-containing protein [Pararhizobium sp. BT-229]MCV9964788.1 TROVE domain-containing protein [Pararhizobium sp. BT-229]